MHAPSHHVAGFVQDCVERLVDEFVAGGGPPGLAYGVLLDGELVLTGGRGGRRLGGALPDADTVFRIASMTKSFTAATVLLLRDDGMLRLDDEVARYLPEAAGLRSPTDDGPVLTVRHLLTMTAGLPTDDPWGDRQQDLPDEEFARQVRDGLSLAWTPGTAFEYSNTGYALLGRVISAAAGEPYRQVVSRRLLRPLGMSATCYDAGEADPGRLAEGYHPLDGGWQPVPFAGYGAFAPMGGLFSTVRDLAGWVAGFLDAYPPRDGDPHGGHPLRRSSRRELQQPHYALPVMPAWAGLDAPPVVRAAGYGFGLVVEEDPVLGRLVSHSGGYPGFGSHMRWHPGSGTGVVLLGNSTYTPVTRLGAQLVDVLLAHRPVTAPGRVPVPAGSTMRAATQAARADVTRLITDWDDDLAARVLADNVDADLPLPLRRAAFARWTAEFGPFRAGPSDRVRSSSPAHCSWWLSGTGGSLRVEIRLTPQVPPKVQTLAVTPVPDPPAALSALAERIAAALGRPDPLRPDPLAPRPRGDAPHGEGPDLETNLDEKDGLDLEDGLDLARAHHQLRVAAAWAGPSLLDRVLAGDGAGEATFLLVGERARLILSLSRHPVTGRLLDLTLTPEPPQSR